MRGLWLFLAFVLLVFIGLAVGIIVAWEKFGISGLVISLACYTLAWVLGEIATGMIFYSYGTLTVKTPRKDA